jgi:selenocysteine-specific elongation factor
VLDPGAPDRKRRSPQRLAWLDAMAAWLAGSGLLPLLAQAPHGLDESRLTRLTGTDVRQLEAPAGAVWVQASDAPAARILMLVEHWTALLDQIDHALHQFHQAAPDEPGLDPGRLRRIAVPRLDDKLWKPALETLIAQQRIYRHGPWLHRPGHATTLSDAETALAAPLLSLINAAAFDPPWTRDLAKELRQPEVHTRQLLRKLMRRGELFQVVQDLFYHREQIASLASVLSSLASTESISAAAFRDATGLGRKRAIQLLDFFGRLGYTRRVRDHHVLRGGAIFLNHRIDAPDKLT